MRGFTTPIFPEEEAIIYGEDGEHGLTILQTYLFHLLRRSMDRQSGIAGLHSVISWGGLYERAYEHSRQGFAGTGDAWGKSRDERINYIRNQVRRIEKRGLIKLITKTGGTLQIEFVIFNQFKDTYFNYVQNKLTSILPPQVTRVLPDNSANKNNYLSNVGASDLTTVLLPELTTSPKESNITATTARDLDCENVLAGDAIASAMLAGGMQEYHVFMGLPVIHHWRSLKGFSEHAAIALIKTRLSKNPQINSVNYFQGAIEQLCTSALKPSNVTPIHQAKALNEFTLPRQDEDLSKWASQYGYAEAPAGMSSYAYRRVLSDAIERRKRGVVAPAQVITKPTEMSKTASETVGHAPTSPRKGAAMPIKLSELISQL